MREYTTQMDAARKGILTEEMLAAEKKEQMELAKVQDAVRMGAESIMDLSSFGDTQNFRAVKNMNRILEGKIVSIYDE